MKVIKYKILTMSGEKETLSDKQLRCADEDVEANLPMVKNEAYNGEYIVEDDGRPDPAPTGDPVTWDELDTAYQKGVNSAYDQ